jgi:hypothetical protein
MTAYSNNFHHNCDSEKMKVASSQTYSLANENIHSSMLTVALLQMAVHFMKSLASFSAVFSGMFYSMYLLNLL